MFNWATTFLIIGAVAVADISVMYLVVHTERPTFEVRQVLPGK